MATGVKGATIVSSTTFPDTVKPVVNSNPKNAKKIDRLVPGSKSLNPEQKGCFTKLLDAIKRVFKRIIDFICCRKAKSETSKKALTSEQKKAEKAAYLNEVSGAVKAVGVVGAVVGQGLQRLPVVSSMLSQVDVRGKLEAVKEAASQSFQGLFGEDPEAERRALLLAQRPPLVLAEKRVPVDVAVEKDIQACFTREIALLDRLSGSDNRFTAFKDFADHYLQGVYQEWFCTRPALERSQIDNGPILDKIALDRGSEGSARLSAFIQVAEQMIKEIPESEREQLKAAGITTAQDYLRVKIWRDLGTIIAKLDKRDVYFSSMLRTVLNPVYESFIKFAKRESTLKQIYKDLAIEFRG